MGKTAYERFLEQQAKNNELANKYVNQYGNEAPGMGDEASGAVIDNPAYSVQKTAELASAQAGLNAAINNLFSSNTQASAAAQAAAKALYTSGSQSKTPQTLIPGMSYTEWLTKGGMNGMAQKEYDAAVRAAETDYAKTLALYGQNAETLGRAGLTGSGYSDYLTGAGFSAMQGAKVAAADTKALTEAQQRMSYADYLAGVEAQNAQLAVQNAQLEAQETAKREATAASIKGTIDQMVQSGMDDKSIMAYVRQHYGDEFLGYVGDWIGSAHLYLDPILAQQKAADADAQAVQYKQQIYSMLSSGQSAEAVRANMQYVMGLTGADTSQLDAWIAEAQAAAQPTAQPTADQEALKRKQAAITDYEKYANEKGGDYAKLMMQQLGYTDDEIANAAAVIQGLTTATQSTLVNLDGLTIDQLPTVASINNEVTLGRMSAEDGEKLKVQVAAKRAELIDKWYKNLSNEDAPDFVNKMHDLYESNDISREDFAKYVTDLVTENITSIADDESVKEPVVEIAAIIDTIENNGDVYGDIEDEVLNAIADTIGMEVNFSQQNFLITFTVGDKKESVGLRYKYMNKEERQKISDTLGAGTFGEIREYNGKLYQFAGGNTWLKIKGVSSADAGGKDIAPIIYELLLAKYK